MYTLFRSAQQQAGKVDTKRIYIYIYYLEVIASFVYLEKQPDFRRTLQRAGIGGYPSQTLMGLHTYQWALVTARIQGVTSNTT